MLRTLTALLLALALGAGGYAAWSYRSMAQRLSTLEGVAEDYAELKQSVDALKAEVAKRRAADQSIRDNRTNTSKAIQEAARADTDVADFITTPLPDGLRAAYLKARDAKHLAPPDNH